MQTKREFIYHGSGYIVRNPDVIHRTGRYKDFGPGFYCTQDIDQAGNWAIRRWYWLLGQNIKAAEYPVVNVYTIDSAEGLKKCPFRTTSKKWAQFVADCRTEKAHNFDIVEGPVADDDVLNAANKYINNIIDIDKFLELCRYKKPSHQIAFCTADAVSCLTYAGHYGFDTINQEWRFYKW